MREEITIWDALRGPFNPSKIRWRVGATNRDKSRGMALAYIDARDLFDRLDDVLGCQNWQTQLKSGPEGRVFAGIGIRSPESGSDLWIWKWDGAGATDFEGAKGAVSDALKRAGVQHGIGRYLYDLDAPWVPIDQKGKTWILPSESLGYLKELLIARSEGTDLPEPPPEPPPWTPRHQKDEQESQDVKPAKGPQKPTSAPSGKNTTISQVWRAGFRAAEECDAEKFAALDYAGKKLKVKNIKQLEHDPEALAAALAAIEEWLQVNSPKKSPTPPIQNPNQDDELDSF